MSMRTLVLALYVLSGAWALVYEVVWTRVLVALRCASRRRSPLREPIMPLLRNDPGALGARASR